MPQQQMGRQPSREGETFSSLVRDDFRRSLRWPYLVFAAVVALYPLINLAATIGSFTLRGPLDVYALAMTSPAILIFALLCVLLTALPTYQEVGHRYLSMLHTRTWMRDYFVSRLLVTAIFAFIVFFLFAFLPFVAAFWVWPAIGNPSIDLSLYELTPAEFNADTTFSQLLQVGPAAFGVVYSLWVAFNAALFSSVGILCLLVLRNPVLALAVPIMLYVGQSLFAALFDVPHSAFLYAVFPFGLTQSSIWQAVAPSLALAIIAVVAWWLTLQKARFVPGAA